MGESNCTGLHPYGPCAPTQGCNAPPEEDLRGALAVALRRAQLAEDRAEMAAHDARWGTR